MSRASQKRPIISLAQSCRYSSLSRESKSIGDEFATKTNGGQIPRRGLLFKAIPSGLMENTLSYSAAMLACLCFVSCGAVQTVKETTANAGQKVAQFSLADIGPAKVGVVEVREKISKSYQLEANASSHLRTRKSARSGSSADLSISKSPRCPT